MVKATVTQNVRYVQTATLTKVLEPLSDDCIKRLKASRTFQTDACGGEPSPNWISIRDQSKLCVTVNYNALLHGRFSKSVLYATIEQTGCQDMIIEEIDILIPKETRIAERLAEEFGQPSLAREYFIAQLHQTLLRGEEKQALVLGGSPDDGCNSSIMRLRTNEGQLGFDYTILDLENVMWAQNWRETVRKRVCGEYREAIEGWKTALQHTPGNYTRELMWHLFGKGLVNTRTYGYTAKKGWHLISIGRWDQ